MIVDGQYLEPGAAPLAPAEICIAGAGAAGITIARELARAKRRVILLEAGSTQVSARSQAHYVGENAGAPYLPLDTSRLRYFGGTTNHWGGWCRELADHDFEVKDYVADSGWPIAKSDLQPYLEAAAHILEIVPPQPNTKFLGAEGDLEMAHWAYSPPVRFGRKYFSELAESVYVTLVLNANLVDIEVDPGAGRVRHFAVRAYGPDAPILDVRADQFVLACGGIENARILLNANTRLAAGVGNRHDLVGRYFADHLHFDCGLYVDFADFLGKERRFVMPSFAFMNRNGILSSTIVAEARDVTVQQHPSQPDITHELCRVAPELARWVYGTKECRASILRVMSEQAPNPRSRVTLSDDRDAFGLRRVRLEWNRKSIDKRTLRDPVLVFSAAYARSNLGRVRLYDWLLADDEDFPDDPLIAGAHHMGTTRMAATPRHGVVDSDCRVYGTPNLFVAGSSVFPTSGVANPTLTIVQLALRLADHLRATS